MALTIFEIARLKWCPGLVDLSGRPHRNVQDWIATATFAPSTVQNTVVLSGISKRIFLEALGSDINRTSSAASETLKNIVEIDALSKSMAWPYVKLYYAALFYAHTLLRIWGRSPTYLRTTELMPLRAALNAYSVNPPYKVQTGQYLLEADMSQAAVVLSNDKGSGGAHEFLWREFHRALSELDSALLVSPYLDKDKKRVSAQLNSIISLISKNGQNVSWPSLMRNDIQYRQAEGVWYPYHGRAKTSTLANDVIAVTTGQAEISSVIDTSGGELARFRSTCLAIACLVRGVIADMSKVGGPKSFLQYGQRKFEDSVAI